jgi:hypothetical protein
MTRIEGLVRCEDYSREQLGEILSEMTHTVYPHDDVFGSFCTIHEVIDRDPLDVFAYMADPLNLVEWTYSLRNLAPTNDPAILVGTDGIGTPIYVKTIANRDALTVDYHCAWDQGRELWMVYLNRIVPAQTVLKRRGSVVTWTNCHHPYYDANPFPQLSDPKRAWVGDWWPLFPAGHRVEMNNLKRILEHRGRR